MKTSKNLSFSEKIVWRNRILKCVLVIMAVYMVVVGELGLGDSRYMTQMAENVSRVIFFGGMIYIIYKIVQNKKLLNNQMLLKEKLLQEKDELNQALYEKSGGIVLDVVLVGQLFITLTASLMDMAAFYSAFSTLMIIVAAKIISIVYLKRKGY